MTKTEETMTLQKNEVTRISLAFSLDKAAQLPDGQFEAILSTDTLDSYGEHIDVKGIQIPKDKTIRMYWNHQKWGKELPIGTWPKIWKSGGKLMGRGQADLEDEFAVKVFKKIKAGIIDNVSVGLRGLEYDTKTQTWTKSELTECSVVSEGANPDSVVTNKSSENLGFTEDEFESLAKSMIERDDSKAPEKTETVADESGSNELADLKAANEELKSRVGAVEEALKAATEDPSTLNKISVRLAAKAVDKQADELNKITKVILRKDS